MSRSDSVWVLVSNGAMSLFTVLVAFAAVLSFATGELSRAVISTLAVGLMGWTFFPPFRRTYQTRKMRPHLYPNGVAATATIERTRFDRHRRFIGLNQTLYVIEWTFDVDGTVFHGGRATTNSAIHEYDEGDVLWVLYNPIDPSQSVEWPPVV